MDINSTDDTKISIACKVPTSWVTEIDALALLGGITRSQWVANWIATGLGKTDDPEARREAIRIASNLIAKSA